ncbi:MAG: trypsin-like peptidase domain-containing protein [Chloroflexi bacterium]|nr:trypsin-like peptidase domain-containing protein [Chloroflexota bacterium]
MASRWVAVVVVSSLVSALVGGAAAGAGTALMVSNRADTGVGARPAQEGLAAGGASGVLTQQVSVRLSEERAVIAAVDKLSPAVVTVMNSLAGGRGSFGRRRTETAAGSGVIVDPRGYILTNEHVVRGAQDLSVSLASGETFPARLVGTDQPFTDLAVIQIAATNLPAADFGDSDALQLGQLVIAMGSALGDFRNSVTLGIVSGMHRSWQRPDSELRMEDLVQTDAAINHGNSGGPLANSLGQVVGINTSVIRSTGAGEVVEGIGFAIPSNTARRIAQQLVEQGRVSRPFLGVLHQTITPAEAALYDLPTGEGIFLLSVTPGGPAALAGLQEGDIVTKIGDISLDAEHPFLNTLMRFGPGAKVPVTFFRGKRSLATEVTLTERP